MKLILPRNKKVKEVVATFSLAPSRAITANTIRNYTPKGSGIPIQYASPKALAAPPAPTSRFPKQPGDYNKLNSFARDILQAGPRAIKQIDLQFNNQKEFTPQSQYQKFFLGEDKIQNLEDTTRQNVNTIETLASSRIQKDENTGKDFLVPTKQGTMGNNLPSAVALPLGALVAASDLTPFGGAKKQGLKQASKGAKVSKLPTPPANAPKIDMGTPPSKKAPKVEINEEPPKPDLMARQDAELARRKTPVLTKIKNAVTTQSYDPIAPIQRLDDIELKRQKQAGELPNGQSFLLPRQALAELTMRMQNPHKPAKIRNETKFDGGNGREYSVDDIIRHYGDDEAPAARDFEVYRLYKDELWKRQNEGISPSIVETDAEMIAKIQESEFNHPEYLEHNAALRAKELNDVWEKEQAGAQPAGTTEALARNPYYTPRTDVRPEDLNKMKVSGGMRTAQKGINKRKDFNEVPTSPLSLYKQNSINHEYDIARHDLGSEVKRRYDAGNLPGFKETVNAQTVIEHKKVQAMLVEIRKEVDNAKRIRDKIKAEKRKVTSKAVKANQVANKARQSQKSTKRSVLAKLELQAKQADDKVAEMIQNLITKAKGRPDDVLNDLAERDPNYKVELEALRESNKKLTHLTPKERSEQYKFDKMLIEKKYPKPTRLNRDELLQVARAIGAEADDIAMGVNDRVKLRNSMGKRMVTRKASNRVNQEVDAVRGMVNQSRTDLADLEAKQKDLNVDLRETTQYNPRNTEDIQYRENGEVGRIETTPEIAKVLNQLNDKQAFSLLEKWFFRPIANAQKVFWVGPAAPAFKLWNALVKNPLLMTVNAEGMSGIGLRAAESFILPITNKEGWKNFKREMHKRNMAYENALQSSNVVKESAEDVARRANIGRFLEGSVKHPVKTLGDLWKGLSQGLATLDNKQRLAVSYSAYRRALKKDGFISESDALDVGAMASARVFGDFERITDLAKAAEAVIPFTGATQAGTRALFQSAKKRPYETAAKITVLATAMAGFTAYSLSNMGMMGAAGTDGEDEGEEPDNYYKDMIDKGQEFKLDTNWTIVWPGAKKNDKGEWEGVTSIPLTPDFRPMNRAIWKSVYKATEGDGVDVPLLAGELFNQLTGDMANQIYDPEKAVGGEPATGILPSSPVAAGVKTAMNKDTYTGEDLADDYLSTRPRTEQYDKNTTQGAKNVSNFLQGAVTPLQADQLFNQMGSVGDVSQKPEKGYNIVEDLLKPIQPGISLTDDKKKGKDFIVTYKEELDKAPDEATYLTVKALHSKDKGKGVIQTAKEATDYLNNPAALQIELNIQKKMKAKGQDVSPFFDPDYLNDKQRRVILQTQRLKDSEPGDKAELDVIEKNNPWLKGYYKRVSKFFDKINEKLPKNAQGERVDKEGNLMGPTKGDTIIGMEKPKVSDKVSKLFDEVEKIKDSKQRADFYDKNTELTDYLRENERYNRKKREYLGLPQLDRYPTSPAIEKLQDQFFKLDKAGRRGFIKAHPELADHWTKTAAYQLNESAARARYEGEELDDDAKKDAAKVGGSSGGSGGSGYSKGGYKKRGRASRRGGGRKGSGKERVSDPRQYRISTRARAIAKPKVSAKKGKAKAVPQRKVVKPKVTSIKSRV